MLCPKCEKENPDIAQSCSFCNFTFTKASVSGENVNVRVSGLAIVSLVLGILGVFTFGITIVPAVVLGIIGIIQIEKSGGRFTGLGFAIIGIVVSVVALLALVLPVFRQQRDIAFRMTCGSNLSGIGRNAILIYASDYDNKLPRAGSQNSHWAGRVPNWAADNRLDAYGLTNGDGEVSISSSLYLLVKYTETKPKSFVCLGDSGTKEFRTAKYGAQNRKLADLWDFGPDPPKHCSYSYHIPYGPFPLTTSSEPGLAVAADRNPWIPSPFVKTKKDFGKFNPPSLKPEQQKYGNVVAHEGEGQNVLFVDGHVYFEKRSFCSIDDDNIYTFWSGSAPNWDKRKGTPPQIGSQPKDRVDSLLVNDPPTEVEKPKRSWWP